MKYNFWEILIIILVGIVVLVGIKIIYFTTDKDPRGILCVDKLSSYNNFTVFASSTEECDVIRAEQRKIVDDIDEKQEELRKKQNVAASKVCGDWVQSTFVFSPMSTLGCRSTGRQYDWSKDAWIETDDSKMCTRYRHSTIVAVPIDCYEYLEVYRGSDGGIRAPLEEGSYDLEVKFYKN